MTRKELHKKVIHLVQQEQIDSRVKVDLTTGINILFNEFGSSWLKRNGGTVLSIVVSALPKLLRLLKK